VEGGLRERGQNGGLEWVAERWVVLC